MTRVGQGHTSHRRFGQRSLVVGMALAFIVVLWSVQLFIAIMMLEAFMAGHKALLWPSAAASLFIALLNLWLLGLVPKEPSNASQGRRS